MAAHYIVIEGPIGVGKSSVVERLAERMEARTVMEEWGQNPFLTPFYEGRAGAAFQIELFFLLSATGSSRAHPAHPLSRASPFRLRVREEQAVRLPQPRRPERLIYDKLYSLLAEGVPRPDLASTCRRPPRSRCAASARGAGRRRRD
jgi:deoxyadenosine/deoxycytidine kinase